MAAAGRYTPANASDTLDPFFDDDDDNTPDPKHVPTQSRDSGLPQPHLRPSAGPRAGSETWTFDDDDTLPINSPSTVPAAVTKSKKSTKWKWPWQKEQVLTGDRLIALNNPDLNSEYASNFVSTSKYNLITFVPKFFTGAQTLLFPLAPLTSSPPRAILEIRQYLFPVYRHHSAGPWGLPDQQVHHHRSPCRSPPRLRLQGGARRSRELFASLSHPLYAKHPSRNDTNQTPSSTRAKPKFSLRIPLSSNRDGRIYGSATSFAAKTTTSSLQI
jgi:hypothetical protein